VEIVSDFVLASLKRRAEFVSDGLLLEDGKNGESLELERPRIEARIQEFREEGPIFGEFGFSADELRLTLKTPREGIDYLRWREKGSLDAPVVLIDTMGELVNIYAISDIVVLGGAFVPNVGGHNPAETIPFGCKLISGYEIFNQKAMFEAVDGAIFCELETLENALEMAISAPSLRLKQPVPLEKIIEELEKNVV